MSFLGNLFQAPAAGINLPTMGGAPSNLLGYSPSQIDPTQGAMLGGIGGLSQYNVGAAGLPQAWGISQGMISDPNAAGYVGGAGTAAGLGMGAAMNQYGMGATIANMGLDPQMALYNKMYAQNTDQARANATAAGLGTTPIGASSVDWANQNFNINWQNEQLQRAIQGGQAGAGLQAGAAPLFMQSAAYPWQAGQQIGQANLGTLGTLTNLGINAATIPGQQIAGWSGALGQMGALQQQAYGQQQGNFQDATSLAQLQLQQNQQAFNQQQAMAQGLGKILGGVGGFALGGPMGASLGMQMLGGGGGGGGGGGSGWGGQNFSGMNSSPFGGWQPQMGGPQSFGLPGGWGA